MRSYEDDGDYEEVTLNEFQISKWFCTAIDEFYELEKKFPIYADSDEMSSKELERFMKNGQMSSEKRFESIAANHKETYRLLLEAQKKGAEIDKTIRIYKELFPDSTLFDVTKIKKEVEDIQGRLREGERVILNRVVFRDDITRKLRAKLTDKLNSNKQKE